jgi:transposase
MFSHRRHAGWTIDWIKRDAAAIGPDTATLTTLILDGRPHPEQSFWACLGIPRLARQYGPQRLEAASTRRLEIGARSYGSINSILQNGLDRRPKPAAADLALPFDHPNIRGPHYYH